MYVAWLKLPDFVTAFVRDKFGLFVVVCLLSLLFFLHLLLDLFYGLSLLAAVGIDIIPDREFGFRRRKNAINWKGGLKTVENKVRSLTSCGMDSCVEGVLQKFELIRPICFSLQDALCELGDDLAIFVFYQPLRLGMVGSAGGFLDL